MALICVKRLKFLGNALDLWKMAQIKQKWLFLCSNQLKKWKMSEKCEKLLKYVGNALDMWDMA